jgi:hypothetical protein
MRWTASLRVDRHWNYAFRIGPGPARLLVGGKEVLRAEAGEESRETRVSLARGDHQVVFEALLRRPDDVGRLEWRPDEESIWRTIPTEKLQPIDSAQEGLFGAIDVPGRPRQERVDPMIATGGLCDEVIYCAPFEAVWRGSLRVPKAGKYRMALRASGGAAVLSLDGRKVVETGVDAPDLVEAEVSLDTAPHAVELAFHVQHGPAGLEWIWTPPDGPQSIVPRSVLSPPPGSGVGPPLPLETLRAADPRSSFQPLTIVP